MKMGMLRLQGSLLAVLLAACGSSGSGTPGNDGTNGRNSLIRFVEEPPGAHCPNGGTLIRSGIDTNSNGALEDSEATSSAYTCNGSSGGETSRALVKLDPEAAGSNCAQGGTRVSSGLDVNGSGTLESGEVTSTSYVCNGAPGSTGGTQALVRLDPVPPGANCAQGGTAVKTGLDTNGNGALDSSEVTQTQYVCSSQSLYPTKWAASEPAESTGEVPTGFWFNADRRVRIVKTNPASRLKITVSDNVGAAVGANDGDGIFEVRMNGGPVSPQCRQTQHVWTGNNWTHSYHFPFATVCLTDTLPVGLYEFEAWGISLVGTMNVGARTTPFLMVEEILPTSLYGFSVDGSYSVTTSSVFQKADGRTVNYTKQTQGSLLRVTLADTFRVSLLEDRGWGGVMIKMDGNDTNCITGQYDAQGAAGDFHHPIVMTCVLPGVAAGPHVFDVWIRSGNGPQVALGYGRSYPLLLIEEIPDQNLTYTNAGSDSGELSGNWAGVGTRQVQHTVSAAGKTIRVTYSDTFRATVDCSDRWGFYELYVDGRPTGCYGGQHSSNSISAAQDHHHAVNQTCLVKNLSPGPHTFAIWTTNWHPWDGTSCGTNRFGWYRGQNLLLVEELP
jgi:hypothetical protein